MSQQAVGGARLAFRFEFSHHKLVKGETRPRRVTLQGGGTVVRLLPTFSFKLPRTGLDFVSLLSSVWKFKTSCSFNLMHDFPTFTSSCSYWTFSIIPHISTYNIVQPWRCLSAQPRKKTHLLSHHRSRCDQSTESSKLSAAALRRVIDLSDVLKPPAVVIES